MTTMQETMFESAATIALRAIFDQERNGANGYTRHPLAKRLIYTDGIEQVCNAARAFWLLDVIGTEATPKLLAQFENGSALGIIKVDVDQSVAVITMTTEDDAPEVDVRAKVYDDDPVAQAAQLPDADIDHLRELIGCQWVQRVALGAGIGLWLDEEGMLKPWEQQRFFRFVVRGEPQMALAGRAIMLGEELPVACALPREIGVHEVYAMLRWPAAESVVIPATTIADAKLTDEGLVPTSEPEPLNGDRRVWDFENQPRKGNA